MKTEQENLEPRTTHTPTKVSQFSSEELSLVAEFTYYIGNRHLPLYINQAHNTFWIEFDDKIHHQLTHKFPHHIKIEQIQLSEDLLIRTNFESTILSDEK